MRLPISFRLVVKEHLDNPVETLRSILILSIILSIIFVYITLPEMSKENRVAPYETSEYDIEMVGSHPEGQLEKVQNMDGINGVLGVSTTRSSKIKADSEANTGADIKFVNDMSLASRLSLLNRKLLLKGEYRPRGAVITTDLASKVGADVGENITFHWNIYVNNQLKEHEVSYEVTGIARYTAYDQNTIVADISKVKDQLEREFDRGQRKNDSLYSTMYVNCNRSCNSIKELGGSDKPYIINKRVDQLESKRKSSDRFYENTNFQILLFGGLALYVLLFIRSTLKRISRRKKMYGILRSLGSSTGLILRHSMLEATFLLFTTTLLAVFLASYFYNQLSPMYLSHDALLRMVAIAFAINIAIIYLVTYGSIRLMSYKKIVNLLEE